MNRMNSSSKLSRLSLRVLTLSYVGALVALPMLVLCYAAFAEGWLAFWQRITTPVARAAWSLSIGTAVLVGLINIVFGAATAWVLVRYRIPGRKWISALIDLPLAVPTLVTGVMLAILYGPTSFIGRTLFTVGGIEILFARPGIVLALLLVTLPFVVRAVEPVLEEIDKSEEEAAITLGAGPARTFFTVFFPALLPVAVSAGIRSLARALGEFGSLVIVAGNIPFSTLTAPVYIFGEIESGNPRAAAAVSVALLAFALMVHLAAHFVPRFVGAHHVGR